MPDWKQWAWGFWWLRGVVMGVIVISLATDWFGLERQEFLRAVNYFITHWNDWVSWIGLRLPFGLALSSTTLNILMFSGLGVAAFTLMYLKERREAPQADNSTWAIAALLSLAVGVYALIDRDLTFANTHDLVKQFIFWSSFAGMVFMCVASRAFFVGLVSLAGFFGVMTAGYYMIEYGGPWILRVTGQA